MLKICTYNKILHTRVQIGKYCKILYITPKIYKSDKILHTTIKIGKYFKTFKILNFIRNISKFESYHIFLFKRKHGKTNLIIILF